MKKSYNLHLLLLADVVGIRVILFMKNFTFMKIFSHLFCWKATVTTWNNHKNHSKLGLFLCVFFRVVNDATFLTLFLHFSLILIKLNLTPMPSFLFNCVKKKKDLKFISTISSHFGRRCECDIKRVRVKKKKWSLKEVNGICFCFSFLGDFYKSSWITIKRNFYCSHIEPFNLSHEEYRDCDLSIPTRHRKMY